MKVNDSNKGKQVDSVLCASDTHCKLPESLNHIKAGKRVDLLC